MVKRKSKTLERKTLAERIEVSRFANRNDTLAWHSNCCGYTVGVYSLYVERRDGVHHV